MLVHSIENKHLVTAREKEQDMMTPKCDCVSGSDALRDTIGATLRANRSGQAVHRSQR
jgi:hypothetical protein